MNQSRLQVLLIKYGNNECTEEELQELAAWYEGLNALGKPLPLSDSVADEAVADDIWAGIATQASLDPVRQPRSKYRKIIYYMSAAAVVLLGMFMLFKSFWKESVQPSPVLAEMPLLKTEKGVISEVTLLDGTRVKLNADSKLHYNSDFNQTNREIFLDGEAYFEVVKSSNMPFIIHANNMDIEVLGTTFNVKAYKSDKTTEASLVTGKIAITMKAGKLGNKRIILEPNQKVVMLNPEVLKSLEVLPTASQGVLQDQGYAVDQLSRSQLDQTVLETSWIHNRLDINDESLEEIITRLERRYNVNIKLKDKDLLHARYTGSFEQESISEVLDALRLSSPKPFKFKQEKTTILITK
ncbi:hypothetical protein COR50_07120 [Chitinophaga caeni]|uniref:FecR family protein n=1 Tax=Chitinophaga caeni TaxID=2029983 RepID=A0A291QSX9_9BACT|nr:FecR domain-containing protein [Chitinophaga caeni]ATL46973.1 hypothetical protein COR50_07120 [Chitinophaga caeni]